MLVQTSVRAVRDDRCSVGEAPAAHNTVRAASPRRHPYPRRNHDQASSVHHRRRIRRPVGRGGGAYFAAQVQVADSVIRAGSVAISTVPTTAPLAIDALAPGTSAVRSLAVINDGSLPSDLVVTSSKKAGITEFYDALAARVSCSGTEVYSGSLSALAHHAASVGTRCPGRPSLRDQPAGHGDQRGRQRLRAGLALRGCRAGALMWARLGSVVGVRRRRSQWWRACSSSTSVGLGAGARCRQVDEPGAAPGRPGHRHARTRVLMTAASSWFGRQGTARCFIEWSRSRATGR